MLGINSNDRKLFLGLLVGSSMAASGQTVPKWDVLPQPLFDVTSLATDGTLRFERPVAAHRASNGNVLVVDAGSSSIRVLDASGKLTRSVGRMGRGPNEFPGVGVAAVCGDSLLVWDPGRTSIIDPNGNISRLVPNVSSPIIGCSALGDIVYAGNPAYLKTTNPDVFVTRSVVYWLDGSGRRRWQSDSVPEGERVNAHPGGYRRPLGSALFLAFVGQTLVLAPSDSPRVWFFTRDGKRETVAVPSSTRRGPTRKEYEAATKWIVDRVPNPALRTNTEKNLLKLEPPTLLPSYYGAWGDSEGCLWIRMTPPGRDTTELVVVRPGRGAVARVVVNRDIDIQEIGRDHITVLYDDDADETHVAVLKLVRGRGER